MVHEDSNQRTLDHLKVAKHRLQAFQVQEGAATGRSGRATGRQGAGCRDDVLEVYSRSAKKEVRKLGMEG